MKKNFSSSKKPKIGFVALLLFFCVLWGNGAMGQDTFSWNGSVSNDWATAGNWTKIGTAGTDTFPGQTLGRVLDLVVISNGGTPIVASNVNAYGMIRLTITNATGPVSGSTLTINSGATLNVSSASITNVTLTGGNLINNGILNITSSSNAASCFGITCTTPTQLPGSATEYGYSGSGALSINISPNAVATSAAVNVSSLNANSTYKFLFNGATTFNLSNIASSFAFRTAGGASASPLIVGGAGFAMGSVGSPIVNGGLFTLGAQSTTTVNAGTNLTLYSASTNLSRQISSFSSAAVATTFTNKGTINILGASTTGGMFFSTGATANTVVFTINNQGTLNIDLICGIGVAPLYNGNGGGKASGVGSGVFLNNTGTITLKNPATATGTGSAIYVSAAGEAPPISITNDVTGTINFEGSCNNSGSKTSITNNGIINSNSDFITFTTITNGTTGIFNFVRTAATGITKQVTFIVASTALASTSATYTDGTNTYVVTNPKFSFALPNPLIANVLSGVSIPATGTLTKVTGTGDASIAYTSFSTSLENSAFTAATTNSGIINTDTASNLSVISGVATTSTSVIVPGGSAGKGIATFSSATQTINGKLVVQVAGNTTAGIDYDQVINDFTDGGFNITGATLDITGISGTATPVDIVIANGTGTITGPFASVIGLTNGWSINYGVSGKVQLVYSATSPTANTWTGATDSSWINAGNWSAGVPDQNSDVTIVTTGNQPQIATNVNINSLTITSGSLTVNTGVNLTVTDAITNNGSLTIASNANLIQINNVSNGGAGTTTVNRNSNVLSRLDYTLWSSPVTNASQFLTAFSPATDLSRFYNYDEVTNLYSEIVSPAATAFAKATGYLIRMPNDAATAPATQTFAGIFTGVPNNGNISKAVTYSGAAFGYNMVGNPYPSTIDAQAFIAANTANIESSLYFWRKINAASGSAYAVYNPMGSTIATPSSALPNGTIQVGQGFFVKAKSASSVDFTNAMRVANNSNQFFKTKQVASKDRVWLNLTNTSGVFSQALIGYTADATTGVDIYDAKYINDSKSALTSNINDEEYTIQGRPAFDATDVVSLMFKTETAGDYTIALDHFDGVFATGQDVYLLDSKTATETNLKTGSYTFAATAGTDNARFSLKYQKTLKVDAQVFNENSVSVYKNNGTLYVNAGSVTINTIEVYDVQGRLLASQRNVKATTASINNLRASNQVLIVKIAGVNNSVVTKKVVN